MTAVLREENVEHILMECLENRNWKTKFLMKNG